MLSHLCLWAWSCVLYFGNEKLVNLIKMKFLSKNLVFPFLIFKDVSVYLCMCVHACVNLGGPCTYRYLQRPKTLDPPQLELLVGVACLKWVLGAKHGSSTEEISTLNHWALSQAPQRSLYCYSIIMKKLPIRWFYLICRSAGHQLCK